MDLALFLEFFALQFFIYSYECGNSISNIQEYLVQIPENWIDEIKNESLNFGFIFREKIISNVFLFEDDPTWANSTDLIKNATFDKIAHFNDVFAGKIIKIEPRKHSVVKFHPPRKETWATCCTESQEPVQTKTCGDYYGMGVSTAWSLGYTGYGIRVAVVDNGVNNLHPDLVNHVDISLSYSFVDDNRTKIMPQRIWNYLDETDDITSHGTNVAGLIAGEFGNNVCSSGIAHGALIVALKVFATNEETLAFNYWKKAVISYSDEHVVYALKHERGIIDIYSCSFNRDKPYTALSLDTKAVLEDGVRAGREGKGNIFVFSAGNDEGQIYDCNMESFASNENTITIASVDKAGNVPWYAIPCASILASTYGEYTTYNGSCRLETTGHGRTCRMFSGTSASAAIASGVIGLVLQANYNLTWRCVQHIIALTSSFDELKTGRLKIHTNAAEFKFERHFGFGLIDTTAMIHLAETWARVPEQFVNIIKEVDSRKRYLSNSKVAGFLTHECSQYDNCVTFIEHVLVDMSYNTTEEEKLNIVLCSPRKTCSYLLKENQTGRKRSYETMEINRRWTFKTVHFWGETPRGTWIIILFSRQSTQLNSVSINVHGTTMYPYPSITNVAYFKRNISEITTDHALYDFLIKEIPVTFPNSTNIENGSSSLSFYYLLTLILILPIFASVYYMYKLPKRTKNIDDPNSLSINDSITVSSKIYLVDSPSTTGKIYSGKAKGNFCTCNIVNTEEESSESFI